MMSPIGVSPLSKSSALPVKNPPASWTITMPAWRTSSDSIPDPWNPVELTQTSQAYGPASLLSAMSALGISGKRCHAPVHVNTSRSDRYQRGSRSSSRPNTVNHRAVHCCVARQPCNGCQLRVNCGFRSVASPYRSLRSASSEVFGFSDVHSIETTHSCKLSRG
jgi:hypothetical protein